MKFYFAVAISVLSIPALSQDSAELDRRNGFKTIKLGSVIDSVKGAVLKKEFMEKDEFPARLYEVDNDDLRSIGEVPVKDIHLMTYQNLIYKIIVTTGKDSRVMRALEKSFGPAKYIVRTGKYQWGTDSLSLVFHAGKRSMELTYRSYPVIRKMFTDKGKKLEEIANDL